MGLGNPGPDYQDTRHNAGFWFVDQWAGTAGLPWRKAWFRPYFWAEARQDGDRLVLVRPLTFMNRSGAILDHLFTRFRARPEDLLVVFDQMDLPPGRLRLKPHGGPGGHNGLKSIDEVVGGGDYRRLAVGIGRPDPGVSVVDHVLGPPKAEDRVAIDGALTWAVGQAQNLWAGPWEALLNAVNRPDR